jgi:hypothetical protein
MDLVKATLNLIVAFCIGLFGGLALNRCQAEAQQGPVRGHNQVACWFVPNGVNTTIVCANGYWQTTTPEGEVYDGNGSSDPFITMRGAGLILDPGSGRINMKGPSISPASPEPLAVDPGAGRYGVDPRRD